MYKLEFSPGEIDIICAGLGKLKKKIADRIKNSRRHLANLEESRDSVRIATTLSRHIKHNTARLVEVDALLNRLNDMK